MLDPVALKMLSDIPLPNLPGNVDNWQGSVDREGRLLELLAARRRELHRQRARCSRATASSRPISISRTRPTRGFFPLSGSNRYGMSIAGDAVWVMSNKTTLNVRGSFYNMTDEFYNPSLLLGEDGLQRLLADAVVLVALQQRLRLLPRARRDVRHRHQRRPTGSAARAASGTSIPMRGRRRRA